MRWTHLPEAGGLHDQDPLLLDMFRFMFAERSRAQEREAEAEKRKNNAKSPRVAGGRSRR